MLFRTVCYLMITGLLVLSKAAFGYSMNHEYYGKMRPYYGSNVYLTQQAHFANTQATAMLRGAEGEIGKASSGRFTGYALHTGLGLEHFRFVQTGLFYNNVQQTNVAHALNEMRSQEYGLEGKIVLNSPVVNVILGGGAFLANTTYTQALLRTSMRGSGARAGVDLAYQASSNLSLIFSAGSVVESFSDRSGKADVKGITAKSSRVGGGISLWL